MTKPVTAAVEAGYALLRSYDSGAGPTECVRFAWGPLPDRIELVDPDDLLKDIVRRRAIFRWFDTVRLVPDPKDGSPRLPAYAIQKIAPFGSTHFPKLVKMPNTTPSASG